MRILGDWIVTTFLTWEQLGVGLLGTVYETFAYAVYKDKLKSIYYNSTEGKLDDLFDNYY